MGEIVRCAESVHYEEMNVPSTSAIAPQSTPAASSGPTPPLPPLTSPPPLPESEAVCSNTRFSESDVDADTIQSLRSAGVDPEEFLKMLGDSILEDCAPECKQ